VFRTARQGKDDFTALADDDLGSWLRNELRSSARIATSKFGKSASSWPVTSIG
jgi:hypothetical protein